jgi:hypothetical protein
VVAKREAVVAPATWDGFWPLQNLESPGVGGRHQRLVALAYAYAQHGVPAGAIAAKLESIARHWGVERDVAAEVAGILDYVAKRT